MERTHHIYLVPGFLGFAHLGRLTYYGHVRRILSERLTTAGLDPRIHIVRTSPTASLPDRAARVAEVIDATARRGGAPLHLIGHSSGGLDVRLLTAPGVGLPTALDVEGLAARVRTVVTVSTPHRGTPIASFFTTLQGQRLMQLLSLSTIYVLNFGHLPLAALLWMGSFFVRFGGLVAGSELLDELFGKLLEDFTPARRRAVRKLLRDVVRDQALMLQLTPEAMEVFNASVLQRPGTRYGAVVGQAAPPSLRATLHAGIDPAAQVTHALYSGLYRLIEAAPVRVSPQLAPAQVRVLRRAYPAMPSAAANDGIVPTLSQAWGQVVHAAVADHLDVLGHFRGAENDPPHVDWLVSGSDFDRRRFEALWGDVARFLVPDTARQPMEGRVAGDPQAKKATSRKKARRR
jgi:triacylglycerol esterase/lipase EstA (alpha/beta hydrolase family)